MPESDLDLLIRAAQAGGVEAMRHWRNGPKEWEKPDGAGPVSDADLAVNAVLSEQLRGARPDYGWLSEEDADDARGLGESLFIVDPIDGTRGFLAGEEVFAVARGRGASGRGRGRGRVSAGAAADLCRRGWRALPR